MKQLTVIATASPELAAELTSVLGENGVNLQDIAFKTMGNVALMNLVSDNYDAALRALTEAGYETVSDDSLLLEIEDQPGALAAVARELVDTGIGIRALNVVGQDETRALIAVSSSDNQAARLVLGERVVN